MALFKDLSTVLNSFNINMTITKSGDKISVSFMPINKKSNEEYEELQPLIITGTADELDTNFFETIIKPALAKASTTINNIDAFEANLKAVEEVNTKKKEVAKNDLFAAVDSKDESIEEEDDRDDQGDYSEIEELASIEADKVYEKQQQLSTPVVNEGNHIDKSDITLELF